MKAPKILRVTPQIWSQVKEDLKKPHYQKMTKTARQIAIGKKYALSDTTVYNIDNSSNYMDYLKKFAPSAVKWYESVEKKSSSKKMIEIPLDEFLELMASDFVNKLMIRRLKADLKLMNILVFIMFVLSLINLVLKIVL